MDENGLLRLKKEIEKSKSSLAELQGQQKYLMQELKDKWKCNNLEAAETLLDKMEKDIDKLKSELDKQLSAIEEKYESSR